MKPTSPVPPLCALMLALASATTLRAQEVRQDDTQVRPLQSLTRQSLLEKAQLGIGVAVALNPETAGVKKMADFTELVLDEAVKSTDFRNQITETHLLVVSAETSKLQEIRNRDGNLHSPEAQAIINDLRQGHFSVDSPTTFLAKSVFSGRMVYGVASHYYVDKWSEEIFADALAKRLPGGNQVEQIFIGKRGFARTYTTIRWNYLKVLGENSRQLTDALKVELLKAIGRRLGHYTVENTLDRAVEQILRDHPSIPEATTVLRLDIMNDPRLMLPLAQPALPAPRPVAAAPLLIPAEIRLQRDPVLSAASVQHQIIEEQHYHVSSGASESAHSEHTDHPTHSSSLPSSVSIGGSFTGGSGSTLFTRF